MHIRAAIDLVSRPLLEAADPSIDWKLAKKELYASLRGGGYSTVLMEVMADLGMDPYTRLYDPENKKAIETGIDEWIDGALDAAHWNIKNFIKNGKMKAWRAITAGPDWTPARWDHPGIYWSWDESAAEAHWGGEDHEGSGPVTWVIEAYLPALSIDWIPTIVQNANPDYSDEKEVRIHWNAPVEIIRFWQEK